MDCNIEPMTLELAPLHGVTNRVFRRAYFAHFAGFDRALAPFVLAVRTDRMKENHFKDFIPDAAVSVPVVPQLLGNDPEAFVESAKALASFGYSEVNWNLGCPYPMVTKKTRGSGLLPHPERIARFLDDVCPFVQVSVKLRLGLADPEEIIRLMPILNEYPLIRVIIHPRIGKQMYAGSVNLDGFERAARLCTRAVSYNGDITDAATFGALRRRFPFVREWMIGRWALYDPFLPGRLKGLAPVSAPLEIVREFHDDLYESYREILCGPAHALDKMKEVWTYIGRSIKIAPRAFEAIARAKSADAYERAVRTVFSEGEWKGSV